MITTNTGAKKLESSDNWREIFPDNQGAQGAHNASVGAHDAAICQTCQTINGTTNNSGHTINSGEFFIANGGKYKATASIPVNEAWSGSAQAVSDNDLINALNSNMTALSDQIGDKLTKITRCNITANDFTNFCLQVMEQSQINGDCYISGSWVGNDYFVATLQKIAERTIIGVMAFGVSNPKMYVLSRTADSTHIVQMQAVT